MSILYINYPAPGTLGNAVLSADSGASTAQINSDRGLIVGDTTLITDTTGTSVYIHATYDAELQ